MTFAPRCVNCCSRPATAPSSVVQTGVKSLGWEKRTAQPSPIHSWKWMVPWGGVGGEIGGNIVDAE